MFETGQMVVCVETPDSWWYSQYCPNRPVEKGIYTIRDIATVDYRGVEGVLGFTLEEVVNPHDRFFMGIGEPAFHSDHFKPLKKKPDISVFTKMLCEKENV